MASACASAAPKEWPEAGQRRRGILRYYYPGAEIVNVY